MYINAGANSVILQPYIRHDFHNIIFKAKYKLYIVPGLAPSSIKFIATHLLYTQRFLFTLLSKLWMNNVSLQPSKEL